MEILVNNEPEIVKEAWIKPEFNMMDIKLETLFNPAGFNDDTMYGS
ncbi:hypothetical protein [Sediminibacterium ginsengisoli]|uniref:Uncharacterized protein n=1 Tax=Sediminibacterium ginsengisoli TaxID=413434 RepID=A0A1T4P979_9BACT|nr:hypothetical protein [Sediminibacterium ginsengisoli]SJZ88032.1 hypothetical protein SAMN04488132_105217 [Sediminibacterium ginsengisoli]